MTANAESTGNTVVPQGQTDVSAGNVDGSGEPKVDVSHDDGGQPNGDATDGGGVTEDNILGDAVNDDDGGEVNVNDGDTLLDVDSGKEEVLAPEKYEDFTVPEDAEVSAEDLQSFSNVAKELNLTQKQAQALLERELQVHNEQKELMDSQRVQTQKEWVDALKKDSEFGGKKLNETIERANRSLRTFADEPVLNLLKESGYANNPDIIKMFAKIDMKLGEDKFVEGGGKVNEQDPLATIYDHPTSKELK